MKGVDEAHASDRSEPSLMLSVLWLLQDVEQIPD
jgi:hypothetical protein